MDPNQNHAEVLYSFESGSQTPKGVRNNFAKGQFKLELSNRNMKKWMKKEIDWTEDVGRNDGLRAGFKK